MVNQNNFSNKKIVINKINLSQDKRMNFSVNKFDLMKKNSLKINQLNQSVEKKTKFGNINKGKYNLDSMSIIYSRSDLELKISEKDSYNKAASKTLHEDIKRSRNNLQINSKKTITNISDEKILKEGQAFIENSTVQNFVEIEPAQK